MVTMMRTFGLIALALLGACEDKVQQFVSLERARVVPAIERLLGTPFSQPVPLKLQEPELFRRTYTNHQDHPEAKRAASELWSLWKKLHLVSGERPSEASLPSAYHRDGTVYVRKPTGLGSDRSAMWRALLSRKLAHELVHAHRYGEGLYSGIPQNARSPLWATDDTALAAYCLVEGDALFAEYCLPALLKNDAASTAQSKAVRSVGGITKLDEQAAARGDLSGFLGTAPYRVGAQFIASVLQHSGTRTVRDCFREPPRSTEQILHPEKYLGATADTPERLRGTTVLKIQGSHRRLVSSGSLGELLLQVIFSRILGHARATRVAAGWDGCLYRLYKEKEQPTLLVMFTVWDSEDDAHEFASAWCDWAGGRDGKPYVVNTRPTPVGARRSLDTKEGHVVVLRRGRDVVVLDGCQRNQAGDLLAAVWRTTKRGR